MGYVIPKELVEDVQLAWPLVINPEAPYDATGLTQ